MVLEAYLDSIVQTDSSPVSDDKDLDCDMFFKYLESDLLLRTGLGLIQNV